MNNTRKAVAAMMVGLLCISVFPFFSSNSRATGPDNLGIWVTAEPSSWHAYATYQSSTGYGSSGSSYGSCEVNDHSVQSAYNPLTYIHGSPVNAIWTITTGGYTNSSYNGPIPGVIPPVGGTNGFNVDIVETGYYDSAVGDQPIWANSTPIAVWMALVFASPSSTSVNRITLALSVDSGANWRSANSPDVYLGVVVGLSTYFCNVTTWQTWTPTMLKSNSTMVRATLNPYAGANYDVDYLGIYYAWYAPSHWIPAPPAPPSWVNPAHPPSTDPNQVNPISFNFNSGSMSLIGLLGLIVMPPATVWIAKNSDMNKGKLFLGALVIMALSGALFMG